MTQRLLAALGLLVVSPLLILATALVLLDGRPVIFRQSRLGRDRAPFTIWKLRTMHDGRVTALGRVLRASGVDELPQLVNIAAGQMRFIGPRPLTVADVERLGWGSAEHDGRWAVEPGLTGYAQLSPVCDRDLSWRLDTTYAGIRGPRLDLRIVAASVLGLVRGRQAARDWFWGGAVPR